jgi:hypothetical protein
MNSSASARNGNRREFLRGSARWAALSVLMATAGWNFRKRLLLPSNCINEGLCHGCSVFAECSLPNAQQTRRASPGKVI